MGVVRSCRLLPVHDGDQHIQQQENAIKTQKWCGASFSSRENGFEWNSKSSKYSVPYKRRLARHFPPFPRLADISAHSYVLTRALRDLFAFSCCANDTTTQHTNTTFLVLCVGIEKVDNNTAHWNPFGAKQSDGIIYNNTIKRTYSKLGLQTTNDDDNNDYSFSIETCPTP
eukprot:scaffold3632_cov162-Amphora_coffeaeformis.AAC.8